MIDGFRFDLRSRPRTEIQRVTRFEIKNFDIKCVSDEPQFHRSLPASGVSLLSFNFSLLSKNDGFLARRAMFFFLKALISERYVMLLAGRWWKLAYDQLHDDNRTEAQSAQAFGKDFRS